MKRRKSLGKYPETFISRKNNAPVLPVIGFPASGLLQAQAWAIFYEFGLTKL
jgi:hypothetical protein